jgi:ATP-binding cassette subfamily F protein 3
VIRFNCVRKQYGAQVVLADASFQINPGDRVGVVGPNGSGKSTVFNLIVGEITPDKGDVVVPRDCRMGYLHQQINPRKTPGSLIEYAEDALPALKAIHAEIHAIDEEMNDTAGDADSRTQGLLRRLGELQTEFEHMGGYVIKHRAEKTLCGLGFQPGDMEKAFDSLSGGWQLRAALARVLIGDPDILLLDEPTNYLDIPAVEWLRDYLHGYRGTMVLVSHDRYLLNTLTNATIEIANGLVERYSGNYDFYARTRVQRVEQRVAAMKNQDRKREQLERFITRFKAKNTFATQAQSRIKQLARMEKIEIPRIAVSPGRIRLRPPPHCGAEVVRLENAGITYDGERWVLRNLGISIVRGEKLALIGHNGLGKTTLLKMLAGELAPTEGRRVLGHKVLIGYQSQDFAETMDPSATVFGTVKAVAADCPDQEIRTVLGGFGFPGDAIDKRVEVLSGGEKVRLAFARLLVKPPNFLVLDEPTTHLDIQARETLESALMDYKGTICMVSHDVEFVRRVATAIVAMTPPGITRYHGGYDYYHEKVSARVSERDARTEPKADDDGRETAQRPAGNARKEARRQRARERQELHERTKDLKKAIRRAEQEVERLEAEKSELTLQIAAPGPDTDFASISRRLKQLQYEIEIATGRWEEAAQAFEQATATEAGADSLPVSAADAAEGSRSPENGQQN